MWILNITEPLGWSLLRNSKDINKEENHCKLWALTHRLTSNIKLIFHPPNRPDLARYSKKSYMAYFNNEYTDRHDFLCMINFSHQLCSADNESILNFIVLHKVFSKINIFWRSFFETCDLSWENILVPTATDPFETLFTIFLLKVCLFKKMFRFYSWCLINFINDVVVKLLKYSLLHWWKVYDFKAKTKN